MSELRKDEIDGYNKGFNVQSYKDITVDEIVSKTETLSAIAVTGLIITIEEGIAKNDSVYTKGKLQVKDKTINFAVFGMDKEKFIKAYKIDKLPKLVRYYADEVKYFNGFASITKTKDVRPLNTPVDDYVYTCEYPTDYMIKTITGYIKGMKIPELKAVAEKIIETYQEKMMYYPLSPDTHNEKGGYLQHIYNCITEVVTSKSGPKKKGTIEGNPVKVMNEEILVTAIMSYMIGIFQKYDVDIDTGIITEIKPNIKPRERSVYLVSKIIEEVVNDGLDNGYIKTMMSCLSDSPCCDWLGNTSAETIESLKFRYIVKMEIVETQAVNIGYNHLIETDSVLSVNILGKPVNLIRYF